jgi:peroxiredoxin/uncharacterized membrane protein YphA (DoxX/SURF4 family)
MPAPEIAAGFLAARLVVAVVFVLAGVAKLRDVNGTWSMLRAFGVGVRLSDFGARALPMVELALGVGLVITVTSVWAAAGAVALLAAFTAAIGWNLAHGRRPECRCFGQIGNAPIGGATIVRNVVFMAFASSAFVAPPALNDPAALGWAAGAGAYLAGIAIIVALAGLGFLTMQILAQQGRIMLRLDQIEADLYSGARDDADTGHEFHPTHHQGLPVGASAPAFALPTLDGEERTLASMLVPQKRLALFFVHPTCGPCRALLPQILRWHTELSPDVAALIVSEGDAAANREFMKGLPAHDVLLQTIREVADAYGVTGTPGAVLIEGDGTIGSTVAMGSSAIAALAAAARTPRLVQNGTVAVGTIAPEFTARTAKGEPVQLADWRGEEVVLIFWSPSCGFCRQAEADVVAWERRNGRRVVIVSSAPDQELVASGFGGPFVVDAESRIMNLFGARGTPMAVRITAEGVVDSELAAGRTAIGALFETRTSTA